MGENNYSRRLYDKSRRDDSDRRDNNNNVNML